MSEFVLEANLRELGTHGKITQLRAADRVPAVVYGPKNEALSIEIEYNPLHKTVKEAGLSNIITLKLDKKEIKTIIREYQMHSVSGKVIHVDFLALDPKHAIRTEVPLDFVGVSSAVREHGGKLNLKNEKVIVEALPDNLPSKIEVDLDLLTELGQKLLISDLKVADGVKIINDANDPVVDVNIPKKIKIEDTSAAVSGTAEATKEGEVASGEAGADKEASTEAEAKKE